MDAEASKESLKQIYDSLADQYEVGDGINDYFTLPIIRQYCPRSAQSVLEVCCGVGRIATELAERIECVWGIDLSKEMIGYARQRSQGVAHPPVFVEGDLLAYDFHGQTFDYIYGVYFVTYFETVRLFDRLISLTRPGGRIVIIDGLLGPGATSLRLQDLARQYLDYVRFLRQRELPVDHLGWFTHRLKRRTFLTSSGWKKVERWKRENSGNSQKPIWAEEFRRRLPDAKIEHITPRLACAIWDKNS